MADPSKSPNLFDKTDDAPETLAFSAADLDAEAGKTLPALESELKKLAGKRAKADSERARLLEYAVSERCRKLKKLADDFEKTNDRFLLVFRSTHDYYKIIGHSLLFFTQHFAPRIGWKIKVHLDTDKYSVSSVGVVALKQLDRLEANLTTLGISRDPKCSTPELIYLRLPKVFTEPAIQKMFTRHAKRFERLSAVFKPDALHPQFASDLRELATLCFIALRQLRRDQLGYDYFKTRIFTFADRAYFHYLEATNARSLLNLRTFPKSKFYDLPEALCPNSSLTENFFQALVCIHTLQASLAVSQNYNLGDPEQMAQICELAVKLEEDGLKYYQGLLKAPK